MEEMWLARDENGALYFHGVSKPKKKIKVRVCG